MNNLKNFEYRHH